MTTTIKKYKGNWLVDDGNGGWVGFTDHDEAVKYAYDEGTTEFIIKYSNAVMRKFDREGIEYFVLRKMA